jgi:hypothetical protein
MGGEETEKEERKIEASLATTPAFNLKSKVTQSQRDKFKVSPLSLSLALSFPVINPILVQSFCNFTVDHCSNMNDIYVRSLITLFYNLRA